MQDYTYVIVGGGMTADAAVKGIREIDEKGAIAVLGAEPDPPYQRPPLSKALWTQDKPLDTIWCGTEAKGADVRTGTRVTALDPDAREVRDANGNVYRYEQLLLATGGSPRRLPFESERLFYYRTCEDYRRLRGLARKDRPFAVVGAGFIGSEMAAALTVHGAAVTMVFPERGIAGRMLPPAFAAALTEYYRARGVTMLPGCKLSRVDTRGDACVLTVDNGDTVHADGIVAGLGLEPNTGLAREAGLRIGDGIAVDAELRTSAPGVFAAGDAAEFTDPVLETRRRVEHEDNALTMGRAAGRNMAGENAAYRHQPFFYSDLFDAGYEAVGRTDASLETVTDLRDVEEKGVVFYLETTRVRGVLFWNLFGKVDAGRELIAAPGPHTPDGLRAWARERLAE
ncbi:MAG: FAD-dependent oxidoreductase [Lentisphaerae bacterium]|nr:FAD-dependent oxidoreductase [Lentisphaerota bacterium]